MGASLSRVRACRLLMIETLAPMGRSYSFCGKPATITP